MENMEKSFEWDNMEVSFKEKDENGRIILSLIPASPLEYFIRMSTHLIKTSSINTKNLKNAMDEVYLRKISDLIYSEDFRLQCYFTWGINIIETYPILSTDGIEVTCSIFDDTDYKKSLKLRDEFISDKYLKVKIYSYGDAVVSPLSPFMYEISESIFSDSDVIDYIQHHSRYIYENDMTKRYRFTTHRLNDVFFTYNIRKAKNRYQVYVFPHIISETEVDIYECLHNTQGNIYIHECQCFTNDDFIIMKSATNILLEVIQDGYLAWINDDVDLNPHPYKSTFGYDGYCIKPYDRERYWIAESKPPKYCKGVFKRMKFATKKSREIENSLYRGQRIFPKVEVYETRDAMCVITSLFLKRVPSDSRIADVDDDITKMVMSEVAKKNLFTRSLDKFKKTYERHYTQIVNNLDDGSSTVVNYLILKK